MKAILLPVAIFAAATMAQDKNCAANYIVEACLGTENGKLATCGLNDYACRCNQYTNILTCFNNCPNDPRKFDTEGQREIFCGYASQFPSTTLKPVAPTGSSTPTQTDAVQTPGSGSNNEVSESGSGKGTATNTAVAATNTNSAADLAMNAGSVLAAVAGVVAVVL
ncbi:hypothetical protein OQA88_9781 [Cercophora sp. LCS_1]